MKFSELIRFFLLPIYKPFNGITELIDNKRKLSYATIIFLFLGVIYTFSVQAALMRGFGAQVEPLIKIAAEEYYYWQRFFQIPFFFITSIIFAGTVRLLSIPFGGKGAYEDLFALFCVSQTLSMFLTMWLPETIFFFVFTKDTFEINIYIDIARQVIGIVWPMVIMVLGVTIIERIKWFWSSIIVLVAAIPITLLMVIFIR
jgi:hypothetical protein